MSIRVLIADDQEMVRVGLSAVLESFSDLTVVATASDGLEAVDAAAEHIPDVVLMDIRMPGIDGVEATRRIRAAHPHGVRIVMLTTFEQDDLVFQALQHGANGFLGKGASPDQLADAIREVHSGGGALSAKAAAVVISRVGSEPAKTVDAEIAELFRALTPRELEMVSLAARGSSNDEIARELFLSPFTVKTHVNRAMAKLAARDRAQLVAFWHAAGEPRA
ncbi:response regulator transcription factor [Microbacterium halophytorum]|uniref:response regulator transcription factor n=1 Tax=Microbacterium halophytorum TaxID=2067568 RepID=UPI000CFB553B|nr:response regulator transcription factor [Microbacterium halophytorum]